MEGADIAVFANVGPDTGLGHLVRCLALSAAIEGRGPSVDLWIPDQAGALDFANEEGADPRTVPGEGNALTRTVREESPGVVVVDSYDVDEDTIAKITRETSVVVVDELGDRRLPVDIVVNNNSYAHEIDYPESDRVLRGPEYCMLRESFHDLPPPEPGEPTNVLVTIGGADLQNSFGTVIRTVAESVPENVAVEAIVGPYFDVPDGVRDLATFHVKPDDIPRLMANADFAVSGGGQTIYELAACGTPAASVCLGDDQMRNIESLSNFGFCIPVGSPAENGFEENLATSVKELTMNDERRMRMAKVGKGLVDGRGAERVASRVEWLVKW